MKNYDDSSIKAAITKDRAGKIFGNKVFLPFVADFVCVTVEGTGFYTSGNYKFVDFSSAGEIEIEEREYFTVIYFKKEKDLGNEFGNHKCKVAITCCEKDGGNIFDESTYLNLELFFRDDSDEVRIQEVEY